MSRPVDAPEGVGAWRRVPLALRVGGLCSGCFLLVAGAVYLVGELSDGSGAGQVVGSTA